MVTLPGATFGDRAVHVPMRITPWTVWHDGWEAACDFDAIHGEPRVGLGQTLVVPGWMDIHFADDDYKGADNRLGIDAPGFDKPGFYGDNMVYIGHPASARHRTRTYVKFHAPWRAVSLVVTSLDSRAIVTFEDEHKQPLVSYELAGGDPAEAHVVECSMDTGQAIRYVVIEADDVVRLDHFQFR